MRIFNPTIVTLSIIAFALVFSGCNNAPSNSNAPASNAAPAIPESSKTESPFNDKEPERYQVEVWQTHGQTVDKYLLARDGEKRRIDSALGSPEMTTTLKQAKDTEIVMANAAKVYSDFKPGHGYDDSSGTISSITEGMWNRADPAVYEKLSSENGVTKYRVAGAIPGRELIVSFDEKLGMPIKNEVYKVQGDNKTLDVTITLNDFKTTPDPALFEIPKDFKKVPPEDMKKYLVPQPK